MAALATLFVLAAASLPWQPWLENRLKGMLEAQGLQNVQLTLSDVGLKSIILKDIKLGGEPPLTLKNITLNYSVWDLLSGKMRELTVAGLVLDVRQANNKWRMAGLENWRSGLAPGAPLFIPITNDQLDDVPLDSAKLDDSQVRVASEQWQMDIPVQFIWQKQPTPELTAKTTGFSFKTRDIDVTTGEVTAAASLKAGDKQWNGLWQIKDFKITGGDSNVPPMNGNGTLSAQSDHVVIQGQFESADQSAKMAFHINYLLNAPAKSELTVVDAVLPWQGGAVSAQQVKLPFGEHRALDINLKIQRVSADALLQELTGKRATATGAISGELPMTINEDGTIVLHQGNLQAEAPGTITMSPEAIPGDNEQVAFVREVLKNFHYNHLSIQADSDKNNKLSVLMTLDGSNPDVLSGRPAKINVHLTGDMLSFIQQNLLLLSDPQKFLERGENAKN